MRHYRKTNTGRRISAEARVCSASDRARLVDLVLHLADELHAHELDGRQRRIGAPSIYDASPSAPADEQGTDHDDIPRPAR